jgi:hypothetical protein
MKGFEAASLHSYPPFPSFLDAIDATSSSCAGAELPGLAAPERPYRAITLMTPWHSSLRSSCTRSM